MAALWIMVAAVAFFAVGRMASRGARPAELRVPLRAPGQIPGGKSARRGVSIKG